ncbi:alpha-2-macroglobulin [Chitinophaga silvatica]|uniref:Alpha-2-macroglobulin n=1 Tax=Chitinophaga silvatica TaxID=2282649 RepID=A0A3E1YCR9_9BACT|nr:alpha-2-macroglobulin family protein [Chitinophaga silvatica]RFS23834.1 alpha-2-macroglobulin [Chitinophaga silvatica]
MRLFIRIFIVSLFFTNSLMAQYNFKAAWKQVDVFNEKGLPKSALIKIDEISKNATKEKNYPEQLKAQISRINYTESFDDSSEAKNIATINKDISAASGAPKAILQSIKAEVLYNYYQRNRYKFYQRTEIQDDQNTDFTTWTLTKLLREIEGAYLSSLSQEILLKQTNIADYDTILIKGNARELRPTLYDLLAHRALDFFKSGVSDFTQPANQFTIKDPIAFAPASEFAHHHFATTDSSSLQYQAVLILQNLLRFHANNPAALMDVDLERIAYMNDVAVLPNKEKLYVSVLQEIIKNKGNQPGAVNAYYALAEFYINQSYSNTQDSTLLVKAMALCESALKLKQLEGKGKSLIHSIEQKSLNISTETVNIPDKPFRAFVTYKNIDKLYFRLIKLDDALVAKLQSVENDYSDKRYKLLLAQSAFKSWEQKIPDPKDYLTHRVEVKVDGLPLGRYMLISSNSAKYDLESAAITTQEVNVSNISYISNDELIFVLDRTTGKPLPGAKLVVYKPSYRDQSKLDTTVIAAKDGSIRLGRYNDYYTSRKLVWSYGNDRLVINDRLPSKFEDQPKKQISTILFTDREIYRPGQLVYFKGIVVERDKQGKSTIQPNFHTTLTLFDVNQQKVDSIKITTNEFGSYSGKFILPTGKLNGYFRLDDSKGNANKGFRVEEYKRPKFYVAFDTLSNQIRLGDNVTAKGKALAYAGNNIDGAKVKYTVSRQVRFPYPWMFWKIIAPMHGRTEIINGETTTNADGSFTVDFPAIPDETVDASTKPIFTYVIQADVTDLNGETRSATQQLNVGYQAVELKIEAPAVVNKSQLKDIKVFSEGLNGNYLPNTVAVTIRPLQPEKRLLRERYWGTPDQFVMDESTYVNYFPNDIYKDENKPTVWPRKEVVYNQSFVAQKDGKVDWSKLQISEGYYEIEVTTTDQHNEKITQKSTIELVDPAAKSLIVPSYLKLLSAGDAVQPGSTATYSLGTSVNDLYLIEVKSQPEYKNELNNLTISGLKQFSIPVKESDRGNIVLNYVAVRDSRLFTVQKVVEVPWDNKELDLKIGTHRDKLLPGEKEKWTVTITGNKGSKVAAEMVANMDDASLDAFAPNNWERPNWQLITGEPSIFRGYNSFYIEQSQLHYNMPAESYDNITYDQLMSVNSINTLLQSSAIYGSRAMSFPAPPPAALAKRNFSVPVAAKAEISYAGDMKAKNETYAVADSAVAEQPESEPSVAPRKNFQETAFFLPELRTDDAGNITFEFTMPESLTKWNFMAAAHTKDLAFGMVNTSIVTQKTLMVAPNAPRFVREGDKINFTAKVSNLSDTLLIGQARLELLDAATMQPVDGWFQNIFPLQHFTAQAGQSTVVSFPVQVPHGFKSALVYRVIAQAAQFSDGEENTIPVLSNSMLVTESLPLQMRGDGKQSFKFEKLLHSDSSVSLQQKGITVEYTSNPAWYAVQSLPYLMEYPYQCAEQVFNRYYANYLASHIVNHAPGIKEVLERWKTTDTAALLSNLQKNEELKSILLEQTPWVLEAKSEEEQKRNIALLFDLKKMESELQKAIDQLAEKQLPDGSFPWFAGMYADRFITQYIVAGIGHLKKITGKTDSKTDVIASRAIEYLDQQLNQDYRRLITSKVKVDQKQIGYYQIHYLYARSFFNIPVKPKMAKAFEYYKAQAKKYWTKEDIYAEGMLAILFSRTNDAKTAGDIIKSLKEKAINNPERGMYWKSVEVGYSWYQAPIETQALMIEAFSETGNNAKEVTDLKTWLLKNKQTSNWRTTKATADAVYAILLKGDNWLSTSPVVTIQLGNTTIQPDKQEAGTGYIKQQIEAKAVKPEMGNIELTVSQSKGQPSWGAVYWQYFEELDKITFAKTPLAIEKELYKEVNTNNGPLLTRITENNELRVGDKVKVRIVLRADRPMEYIHLRDMRAACFEPTDVLSTVRWQDGLGYYQSTKDASTDFFFNYLNKGTHVFEYTMFVTHTGKYSNGISIAECMYAPEFSSHSEGINVKVVE